MNKEHNNSNPILHDRSDMLSIVGIHEAAELAGRLLSWLELALIELDDQKIIGDGINSGVSMFERVQELQSEIKGVILTDDVVIAGEILSRINNEIDKILKFIEATELLDNGGRIGEMLGQNALEGIIETYNDEHGAFDEGD